MNQYATVALCTVEKVPDFSIVKDTTAIAVISEVVAPSKREQHAADLYIEAIEIVPKTDVPASVRMLRQLQWFSSTHSGDPATSSEAAWQRLERGGARREEQGGDGRRVRHGHGIDV